MKYWGAYFCSLLCLATVTVSAATVDGVRLWRAPDHTRLVFDLSNPVEHDIFTLTNPDRLVIDIKQATLKSSDKPSLDHTPIVALRTAARNKQDLRVVLDLKQTVRPKSFPLKKHGEKPDRLVVDLYDKVESKPKTIARMMELASGDVRTSKRNIIISVDAGHGGEDPGALGPKKVLREKHIVLKISRELVRLINRQPGYEAKLVRTGDYYIPHKKRRDIARAQGADLFVSIHADGFRDPRAKGASVYALSRRGATSEMARFLAQQDNQTDLIGGVGRVSLGDKDELLRGVLVDLSMTATMSSSLDVGGEVLRSMGKVARLHKHQVEQAGFLVLKSPDLPSILVETGFISNPGEAKKLNTASYRHTIAKSILRGIQGYFERMPPAGTYVAWRKNNPGKDIEHVIARGDTLSAIAKRYNVSVTTLRRFNGLSDSVIKVGQRIKIPAT